MKRLVIIVSVLMVVSVAANWWFDSQIKFYAGLVEKQSQELQKFKIKEVMLMALIKEILQKRRDEGMQDSFFLDGKPKCTVIQTFQGKVIVIGPKASSRTEYKGLDAARDFIESKGWVVGWIHPSLRKQEG